ncbi:NTP transferase domain-containing protein [Candidatus Pacearchaeota archaeon]|nr:NTP transferase domain-containing protein [Candidatus Pacearchaeota archaeon]
MADYKVCILAAGIGSRMGGFTQHFNKALIPVHGKPAIGHIIEKFPADVEIVIALGYMKEALEIFLNSAYPQRKLTFVNVDKYTGPGTGPGYSLLQCKNDLQCPFIFLSVDTLVTENIPTPHKNWFGVAPVKDPSRFCSVKTQGETILRIDDKVKNDNTLAFIGLAGVKDYETFWNALENNKKAISGEIQVSNGFSSLLEKNMTAKSFRWFDTGTPEAYNHTLTNYPHGTPYIGS